MEAADAINSMFKIKPDDNTPTLLLDMTREKIPVLFAKAGFKCGAEIGVYQGKFSKLMFKTIPGLKMKCVDLWEEHYDDAKKRLSGYDAELIKMCSEKASETVANGSLDFVYIDAGHDFDNVAIDIIKWAPKVRVGGIVSGHDYHHNYQYGVMEAVDSYTKCHNIKQWFVTRDLSPNWFWVVC